MLFDIIPVDPLASQSDLIQFQCRKLSLTEAPFR